jgi:hypothetical protein
MYPCIITIHPPTTPASLFSFMLRYESLVLNENLLSLPSLAVHFITFPRNRKLNEGERQWDEGKKLAKVTHTEKVIK